jgi:glutamyl-tRNA reductase
MAACVIALCRQVFGNLPKINALILGDGELGEFVMQQLMEAGLSRWTFVHRSPERAQAWASRHRGSHAATLADLDKLLPAADVTISALDGAQTAISPGPGEGRRAGTPPAADAVRRSRRAGGHRFPGQRCR